MKNNLLREAAIVGLCIVVGFVFFGGDRTTVVENYGASPGPDHYNTEYFHASLVQGGDAVTKATGTTASITATDICGPNGLIIFAPEAANSSATFAAATSTISTCLPRDGMFRDIMFWNIGLAASTTVFATTTDGEVVFMPAVTGADFNVAGGDIALLRFLRASSTYLFITVQDAAKQ